MYTPFTNKNIATLYMVRLGWIKPEYELTDNVYSYGKLSYKWLSARRRAMVEVAGATWNFRFVGFWRTTLSITDQEEKETGQLKMKSFSRTAALTMNNGFTAVLRKTSFWKSHYVWENDIMGPVMHINSPSFSSTDTITIEQSTAPSDIIPLLAFLGIHMIIIRRQREAAAASS